MDEASEHLFFELLHRFRRSREASCDFNTLECNEAWRLFYQEQLSILHDDLGRKKQNSLLQHVHFRYRHRNHAERS